jgi:hypothetical protein
MAEENQEEKPSFPLEKILTCSLTEWERYNSEILTSQYDLKGVHYTSKTLLKYVTDGFSKLVPENAIVVVDYKVMFEDDSNNMDDAPYYMATGIALVPKEK